LFLFLFEARFALLFAFFERALGVFQGVEGLGYDTFNRFAAPLD
jgi:hypothetical protein